jgi:hypothetical protein
VASSQTTLNSNVNTTKPGSKALWDQWQLLDGIQWASAQLLLKYKGRKKELISHWVMIITFLCSFLSLKLSAKTSLCLSKSKIVETFFHQKNLYTLNPSTQRYHFCYRWYRFWAQLTSGNMFWMRVIMMKVNKGCVTHCDLATYIIKYL